MPPTLKPSLKLDLQRVDSLRSQLSSGKLLFKPQLTSLYVVSTPRKFQLNSTRYNVFYVSYASKQLALYYYWTANLHKILTLQSKFLQPSLFDLHSGGLYSNFESLIKIRVYHETCRQFRNILPLNFTKKPHLLK